jgi:preprotein translocase subunit YajC
MSGLILLPLLAAVVWLMIIPQRRQAKEQRALLANLAEGDAVVTSAGIYGIVTELEGEVMYLEVAEGIELKMSKGAVARRIVESSEAPAEGK